MVNNFRRVQEFEERLVSVSFREGFVLSVVLISSLSTITLTALAVWLLRSKRSKRIQDEQGVVYKPAGTKEEESIFAKA